MKAIGNGCLAVAALLCAETAVVSTAAAHAIVNGLHTPPNTLQPVVFCSTRMLLGPTFPLYDPIDLVDQGCISGKKGYGDLVDNEGAVYVNPNQTGGDGLYINPGDTVDAVEESITLATGRIVELIALGKDDRSDGEASATINTPALVTGENNDIPLPAGKIVIKYDSAGKYFDWKVVGSAFQVNFVTIKAAQSYLLYEIPTDAFGGRFSTEHMYSAGGTPAPGISHITFWVADYEIPEPAAFGLFGIGAGALMLAARRRRV